MGIRTRVKRAFISLGIILIIAGISSYFELAKLTTSSKNAIAVGAMSVKMSTEVLDIVQKHNDVIISYYTHRDSNRLVLESEEILYKVDSLINNNYDANVLEGSGENLIADKDRYKAKVREFYKTFNNYSNYDWYYVFQSEVYFEFVSAMKQYMLASQSYVVHQTSKIDMSVYRSIMVGIVAIFFLIIMLFIFFVLLDTYYLRPVVRLAKSLKDYLVSRTPFVVKVDGKDEVYELKELILDLISHNKYLAKQEREKDNLDL